MTVKLDLFGSIQTQGVSDTRFNAAIRRGVVTGLGSEQAKSRIDDAITEAIQAAGAFHHNILDLPLERVRSRMWGPEKAFVTLFYRPLRTGNLNDPSTTIARVRTAYEPVRWYRNDVNYDGTTAPRSTFGQPQGGMVGMTEATAAIEETTIKYRTHQRPVLRMWIPVTTNTNPLVAVQSLIGTVNEGAFTFGGITFIAETARFDGYTLDWRINQGVTLFDAVYLFSFDTQHWLEQQARYDTTAGEWTTDDHVRQNDVANWEGVFVT